MARGLWQRVREEEKREGARIGWRVGMMVGGSRGFRRGLRLVLGKMKRIGNRKVGQYQETTIGNLKHRNS